MSIDAEKVRALIEEYRGREQERERLLDEYRDEIGDVREEDYPRYDEARHSNALDAEIELDSLLSVLEKLIA